MKAACLELWISIKLRGDEPQKFFVKFSQKQGERAKIDKILQKTFQKSAPEAIFSHEYFIISSKTASQPHFHQIFQFIFLAIKKRALKRAKQDLTPMVAVMIKY